MFTTGRIVFAIVFVVVFVAGLIWSYRKDSKVNKIHFSKSYKVLLAIILFLILQFFIVKFGKFI
jgi:acetylglutamate synthase